MKILTLNSFPLFTKKRKVLKLNFSIFKLVLILLTFLSICSLFFYIFQINQMIKASYLIKIYEKEIEKLSEENKNLNLTFSQLNSLENLQPVIQKLGFEKVDKLDYIRLESSMAAR